MQSSKMRFIVASLAVTGAIIFTTPGSAQSDAPPGWMKAIDTCLKITEPDTVSWGRMKELGWIIQSNPTNSPLRLYKKLFVAAQIIQVAKPEAKDLCIVRIENSYDDRPATLLLPAKRTGAPLDEIRLRQFGNPVSEKNGAFFYLSDRKSHVLQFLPVKVESQEKAASTTAHLLGDGPDVLRTEESQIVQIRSAPEGLQ